MSMKEALARAEVLPHMAPLYDPPVYEPHPHLDLCLMSSPLYRELLHRELLCMELPPDVSLPRHVGVWAS